MAASISLLRSTFADASKRHDRAVVVLQQADMFDPTYTPAPTDISAFQPLVQALVDETDAFPGDVYLVNGDSHIYNSDHPLGARVRVADALRRHGVGRGSGADHGGRLRQQQGLAQGDGEPAGCREHVELDPHPLRRVTS